METRAGKLLSRVQSTDEKLSDREKLQKVLYSKHRSKLKKVAMKLEDELEVSMCPGIDKLTPEELAYELSFILDSEDDFMQHI